MAQLEQRVIALQLFTTLNLDAMNLIKHTTSLLMIACLSVSSVNAQQEVDALSGLWQAKRTFDNAASGELVVMELDSGWLATLGPFTVPVTRDGDEVRLELPDERGWYRGNVRNGEIEGHWIQPRTQQTFARMATPLQLRQRSDGTWAGTVKVLENSFNMYLLLEETEDGRLSGHIRNPESNVGRFYQIHTVQSMDNAVSFLDSDANVILRGTYDDNWNRLSIYFPYNGGTYDFLRVTNATASFFHPRPTSTYSYSVPGDFEDGWEVANAIDVGLSSDRLADLVKHVAETPMDGIEAPQVHSVLIARNGKLVFEEYFHGFTRTDVHGTRSAGKSYTTTFVAAAIRENDLQLTTSVLDLLPRQPNQNDQTDAGAMTIEHLITMTSGLDCDDWDQDSPGGEDRMQEQEDQPDWIAFTLGQKMIAEPGTRAAYCSAGQHLAGEAVSAATGTWLPEFYRSRLAEPMQMEHYYLNLDPMGRGYGGGGIYVTPRDFLKVGQLFLNNGQWKGEQLLPPDWVESAFKRHNEIGDEGYGYGWWAFSYEIDGKTLPAYYAGGNGGQYVIVIPQLDMTIAIMGGNYSQRVMHKSKYEYVPEFILDAVTDN